MLELSCFVVKSRSFSEKMYAVRDGLRRAWSPKKTAPAGLMRIIVTERD